MKAPPWLSVGHLLPRILVAILLLDVLIRFVPPSMLGYRDPLYFYRAPGDALVRNGQHAGWTYGDLSALGNFPHLRLYRRISITSDALGFRNPRETRPVRALLIGDSFGVVGDRDDETLAAQLSAVSGCRIYNAAGADAVVETPSPDAILRLAGRLRMQNGLVIAERLERLALPEFPPPEEVVAKRVREVDFWPLSRAFVFATVSPLKSWNEAFVRRFQNNVVFPNPSASLAIRKTLRNDEWMLFYGKDLMDLESSEARRPVSITYWSWLNQELTRAGFHLLVVLVPSKYTVYYRLLVDPDRTAQRAGDVLLEIERELRAAHVPVLNLTKSLQRQAERDLAQGSYLYFRDDTHWNARGSGIAAAEIWEAWSTSGRQGCP